MYNQTTKKYNAFECPSCNMIMNTENTHCPHCQNMNLRVVQFNQNGV